MSIAERLYTQGFISYPRTETNQYPANFDLVGSFRTFRSHEDYGPVVNQILDKCFVRPKSGRDAGNHPPITPCYAICPQCYNNPPFEDMNKLSGCNQCPNKECFQSMIHLGIGSCRWCSLDGTLTLDPGSGHGGKWKIYCNKCDSFMSGLKEAVKVTVKSEKCATCSCKTIHVEYKRERNPNESTGCVFWRPWRRRKGRGRGNLGGRDSDGDYNPTSTETLKLSDFV